MPALRRFSMLHQLALPARPSGQACALLLADAGREPSYAAVVREHGPADRTGWRGVQKSDEASEIGRPGQWSETCFWKSLKRGSFDGFRFFPAGGIWRLAE